MLLRNPIRKDAASQTQQLNLFFFSVGEYLHPSTLPHPLYDSTAHPKVNGLFLAAWNATFQTGV